MYSNHHWPSRWLHSTGALPLPSEVSHFVGQGNPWGQPREETRAVGAKESTGVLVSETLSSDFDFTSLLTLILLCPIRHFFSNFDRQILSNLAVFKSG